MKPQVGQLVTSTAGRDAGRSYLILQCVDSVYVLVTDGDKRPVANPKKKNIRHLELHAEVAVDLQSRLLSGGSVTDAEVRSALEQLAKARRLTSEWQNRTSSK